MTYAFPIPRVAVSGPKRAVNCQFPRDGSIWGQMTILLKQFFQLLKLLNSETGLNQIAAGIACGWVLGFSPLFSLQGLLILLVIFFFRVQGGAAFASAALFAILKLILAPAFDGLGQIVLEIKALEGVFTALYQAPIIPYTQFNSSVVMGAGVFGFMTAPAIFIISRILITKYRTQVVARFKSTRAWKVVQATSLFKWYVKYEQHFG